MAFFSKNLGATDNMGNTLDPQLWSREIFVNATANTLTGPLAGGIGEMLPIVMDQRLAAEPGSSINYTFNPFTDDRAILGSETSVKANAKGFEEYGLKVDIHVVTHAKKSKGILTQQRTLWNIRSTARTHLTELSRTYLEKIRIATLSGVSYTELEDSSKPYLSKDNEVDRAKGANRHLRASGGNSYAIDSAVISSSTSTNGDVTASDNKSVVANISPTDVLNTAMLEEAATRARTEFTTDSPYKMTPVTRGENGEPMFILLCGLYSWRKLKRDPMFEKYALAKLPASLENDQYARGADAVWDNIIIKRSEHVLRVGVTGDYFERNLMIGAEAMVELYGSLQSDFTEEDDDHRREVSHATTTIRGESKVHFNGVDINVMQLIGAAN